MYLTESVMMTKDERRKTQHTSRPDPEIVSVDDMMAQHAGQWVLMKVREFDKHHNPAFGELVGRWLPSKESEKVIVRTFSQLRRSSERPDESYYLFQVPLGGESGLESREASGELVARVTAVIGGHRARRPR